MEKDPSFRNIVNWLTLGAVDAIEQRLNKNQENFQKAVNEPTVKNWANYLLSDAPEELENTVKTALDPSNPKAQQKALISLSCRAMMIYRMSGGIRGGYFPTTTKGLIQYGDKMGAASGYVPKGTFNAAYENQGGTKLPAGYTIDKNGRVHRPDGTFASNQEIGLTVKTQSAGTSMPGASIHGNSLNNPSTNYGYVLRDLTTDEIKKYGETLYPKTRYTKNFLKQNNVRLEVVQVGTKLEIHKWQHKQIVQYKWKYDKLPPLNKNEW